MQLADSSAITGLFAYMAVGGGFSTTFTLINAGSSTLDGDLCLMDRDGNPMTVTLASPSGEAGYSEAGASSVVASSFHVTIPSGGTCFVTASASDPDFKQGWAYVVSSGGTLGGVATFQWAPQGVLRTVAGGLLSESMEFATIPVVNDDAWQRYTGYAVTNPGNDDIYIKIVPVNEDGEPQAPLVIPELNPLGPGKMVAKFPHQDSAALTNFRGAMVLIAEGGKRFSVVALVQNQTFFTAVPVIPDKAPAIQ
jgi:hypothetical protein